MNENTTVQTLGDSDVLHRFNDGFYWVIEVYV